ncbi:MAG: UbiA family prenyltransferase [Deltaproteobacteria bacterium]|nr:UbiA family prenyltransferase [Deltaproteobacteria bacterium]
MTLSVALRLGRVSNLPTVTSNVLAAIALSGAGAGWLHIAVVCLAMSLMYVAGMYLNDAFDRDIDARERPDRPIPSGQVAAITVFGAGFGMLLAGILTIAALAVTTGAGWRPIASASALAGLIVVYDMHHKGNRLGPLIMGLCRVGVYATAALACGASLGRALLVGCGALLCYLIGLTYVAKSENLRRIGALWPLAFLAVPFVVGFPTTPVATMIFIFFLLWTLRSLNFLRRRQIRDTVVGLIAGISLLDGLLVAGSDRPELAFVAIAAFFATALLQRAVPGT